MRIAETLSPRRPRSTFRNITRDSQAPAADALIGFLPERNTTGRESRDRIHYPIPRGQAPIPSWRPCGNTCPGVRLDAVTPERGPFFHAESHCWAFSAVGHD